MEEGSQDLLGVTVSPWGMKQLKRLANSTRWTFLAGILLTLIYIVNSYVQRFALGSVENFRGINPPFYFELKLHFWYVLVVGGMAVLQVYLFLLFSRKSAAACERVDSYGFNESLGLLTRFNRVALLTILMNLAFAALEIWSSFNFLAMRLHSPK
jgi:hypothetical protein